MKRSRKFIVVFGCVRIGSAIASVASMKGHNVIVVDKDERSFRRLSSEFSGFTVVGDAAEFETIKKSQVANADIVFALTNDDSTNYFISVCSRYIFGVEKVVARVYDPAKAKIFEESGVEVVCPVTLMVEKLRFYIDGGDKL